MRYRWVLLLVSFLATFAFLFSMQAVPPLLPEIMEEYNLSHTVASMLMLLVAIPAVFTSIPGGVLVDRYGVKNLVSIGLILVCLGELLSAYPTSFPAMEVGRLVVGVGGAIATVSAMALISQWFSPRETGLAMGVFGLNMPLATVFSFNLLRAMGETYGWRLSLLTSLIVSVGTLFIWVFFAREKRIPREKQLPKPSLKLGNRQIWLLGLIWATFNMAAISFTTWGPKLFKDFWGVPSTHADFLASMSMIGALVTPFTGYVSDRLGKRKILIMGSAFGMAVSLLLTPISSGPTLFLIVALLGFTAAFLPPPTFALPAEILDRDSVGLGYGVLNTCLNVGVIAGPLLVGVAIDLTRNITMVFYLIC